MEEKILKAIEALTGKVDNMEKGIEDLKTDVKDLKTDVKGLKQQVNAIYDQTANLTEFRTETRQKLRKIESSIVVISKENFDNKVELVEMRTKIAR